MGTAARPNLFDYATSELSQDAFLCWWLAWADGSCGAHDDPLHRTAIDFVHTLANVANLRLPPKPWSVRVERQRHGIDILARIGDTHAIVIEDKVHTREHSNQLHRYEAAIREHAPGLEVAYVYLKTGDQGSYEKVASAGWAVFRRPELLKLLRGAGDTVANAIFVDFRAHVEAMERAFEAYATNPVDAWNHAAWSGFYTALQARKLPGSWEYVANPTGGFVAFHWGWWPIEGGELYLQLEHATLAAKISVDDRDRRRELRSLWCERVLSTLGPSGFTKPNRFGSGTTMTVAIDRSYLTRNSAGLVDLDATAERLHRATKLVDKLVDTHRDRKQGAADAE